MKIDAQEALRYLGIGSTSQPRLVQEMEEVARQLSARFTPRWVYRAFRLEEREDGIYLPEISLLLPGGLARRVLKQSHHAVLLACTVGAEFDALLRREQVRDMSRAVMMDACGGALAEAGCDAAQEEIAALFPGAYLTDRFSPGYGDLPLELQPGICAVLNAQRRIGVTVSSSLLLNPCKSVTAIIGVADSPQPAAIRGCACCNLRESCPYRKGGKTCAN